MNRCHLKMANGYYSHQTNTQHTHTLTAMLEKTIPSENINTLG